MGPARRGGWFATAPPRGREIAAGPPAGGTSPLSRPRAAESLGLPAPPVLGPASGAGVKAYDRVLRRVPAPAGHRRDAGRCPRRRVMPSHARVGHRRASHAGRARRPVVGGPSREPAGLRGRGMRSRIAALRIENPRSRPSDPARSRHWYVTPAATDFAARPFGPDLVRRVTRAGQLGRVRRPGTPRQVAIVVFRAPAPLCPRLGGRALIGRCWDPLLSYRCHRSTMRSRCRSRPRAARHGARPCATLAAIIRAHFRPPIAVAHLRPPARRSRDPHANPGRRDRHRTE